MKLVDLSQPFDPALYPAKHGGPAPLEIRPVRTVAEHGVRTSVVALDAHIGTHLDAPLHLLEGGRALDELPLETFCGTAVALDIPKGPNGGVTPDDLERARPRIEPGDIVLIRSGWADRLTAPEYATHHPYLEADAAEWLAARRVKMVGMDVQSVDLPHSLREKGFSYTSLRTLLRHGIPAVLNLTSLEAVVGRRVTVFALPIGFRGAEGSPARVVALLD